MIALMLSIALSLTPQPVAVDLVEINHCFNHRGEHTFDQVIFYTWSSQRKRYDVREWRLANRESMYPVWSRSRWLMRWHDDGVMREVVASAKRETWTQYDPEIKERKQLEQEQRLPLFPGVRAE
jgi:hypothetical protein